MGAGRHLRQLESLNPETHLTVEGGRERERERECADSVTLPNRSEWGLRQWQQRVIDVASSFQQADFSKSVVIQDVECSTLEVIKFSYEHIVTREYWSRRPSIKFMADERYSERALNHSGLAK